MDWQTVAIVAALLWAFLMSLALIVGAVAGARLVMTVSALQARLQARETMLTHLRNAVDLHGKAIALVDNGNRKTDSVVVRHSEEIAELMRRIHLPNAPERPF